MGPVIIMMIGDTVREGPGASVGAMVVSEEVTVASAAVTAAASAAVEAGAAEPAEDENTAHQRCAVFFEYFSERAAD